MIAQPEDRKRTFLMFNWRKHFFHLIWRLRNNPKGKYLAYFTSAQYKSPDELQQLQDDCLEKILLHAYEKVPYYRGILPDCGVINNGAVHLEEFSRIPILTKEIIRREGEALYSQDYKQREHFINTSGGSTGEPVKLIQDLDFSRWSFSSSRYFPLLVGVDFGESIVKLWGSERDLFQGGPSISARLWRWLHNTTWLNSFVMSEENMSSYIARWNKARPSAVLTYTSSIFELARYLDRHKLKIHTPLAIFCTAEMLSEDVRSFVESVFHCPVLSDYGSREVSKIACECPEKQGLHVLSLFNKVEIIDQELHASKPGEMGDIIVTNLANYSMPLIRYQIGDTAIRLENEICSCGRAWPLIGPVTGRQSDHFCTKEGKLVHGEYFTHLFYDKKEIKQFQVVQRDYEEVEVVLVPRTNVSKETCEDIAEKIRFVLGEDCRVFFTEVEHVSRSASGKYRYTISEVSRR